MGQLYDLSCNVGRQLEVKFATDPLGLVRAKGLLATETGFLVTMIGRNDPDDPVKISKLRQAAATLGIHV